MHQKMKGEKRDGRRRREKEMVERERRFSREMENEKHT